MDSETKIYAKELRQMGFQVPSVIPDFAFIPKENLTIKPSSCEYCQDNNEIKLCFVLSGNTFIE